MNHSHALQRQLIPQPAKPSRKTDIVGEFGALSDAIMGMIKNVTAAPAVDHTTVAAAAAAAAAVPAATAATPIRVLELQIKHKLLRKALRERHHADSQTPTPSPAELTLHIVDCDKTQHIVD